MIIYELTCIGGHRFEGWFGSSDDFDSQRKAALVRCPVCDDAQVSKVPFAKVHRGRSAAGRGSEERESQDRAPKDRAAQAVATREESSAGATAGELAQPTMPALAGVPAEVINRLRALVRGAEDVGARFPEEARRMHYDEAPARSIRGQATPDQAAELRDEGIEFASLPAFLVEDTH